MKFKGVLAGVVCAVMCANTAFAAQTVNEEKVVLTYDKAVEMAVKNNSNMSSLNEAIDYMEKNQEVVSDSLGLSSTSIDIGKGTMNPMRGSLITSAKTLESNIKTSQYSKELIETGSKFLVKTYFNNIRLAESGLNVLEKSYEVQQEEHRQNLVKKRLGMISDNKIQSEKAALDKTKSAVEQTRLAIENAYNGLGTALGINPSVKFDIDYSIEYAPFESDRSVESHISTAISKDPSIKIAETNLGLAEKLKDISVYETQLYSYLKKENDVNAASRQLKDTKDAMQNNMKTAYNNIKTLEAERVALESALEDAKTTYNTVKLNFDLGNVTDFTLKQAELAVLNAENSLLTNASNHDLEVFGFNNPSMLGNEKEKK